MSGKTDIEQVLKQLVLDHGHLIVETPDRVSSLLKDLTLGKNIPEVNLCILALRSGAISELGKTNGPINIAIQRAISRLCDEHCIELGKAEWVVDCWTRVLGYPTRDANNREEPQEKKIKSTVTIPMQKTAIKKIPISVVTMNASKMAEQVKQVVDIAVARSPNVINAGPISRALFKILRGIDTNEVGGEHITRAFDWDGSIIVTTCDCYLAVNIWSASSGEFIERRQPGHKDTYSTIYSYQCGKEGGAIFGNGGQLYYSDKNNDAKRIPVTPSQPYNACFALKSMRVNKDREAIALIKDFKSGEKGAVTVFCRNSDNNDFDEFSIPIDVAGVESDAWNLELVENTAGIGLDNASKSIVDCGKNQFEWEMFDLTNLYIVLYTKSYGNFDLKDAYQLVLASLDERQVLQRITLNGIQNISKHPSENLIAVLGLELTLHSIPDLKTINSIKLEKTRNNSRAVISYSSCGRYLALSYSIEGEIEILNAQTLELIFIFESLGIPELDLSWDVTGTYLAYRFYNSEQREYTLVVLNIVSQQIVLRTASSAQHIPTISTVFKWAPNSSAIACLANNKRIQVFEFGK